MTKKHSKQHGSNVAGKTVPPPIPGEPVPQGSGWLPEEREYMISEAAYFLAENRGFEPGRALDDWLEAELKVKEVLTGRQNEVLP